MPAEQYAPIEQDPEAPGQNELPTYDDLANQNGPNSRFGRWRGWVEKRAAERYADITPEDRMRRRERGWGNLDGSEQSPGILALLRDEPPAPIQPTLPLHIRTKSLSINDSPPISQDDAATLTAPLPFVSQTVEPTHLKINHFGSRFLPHTTSQIRCILPLLGNRMLLVGHDEGLSVLDMFPQEWSGNGDSTTTKGPDEAQSRPIWRGEAVFQMSILEAADIGNGTPQGVVLAVVGPSQDLVGTVKDHELFRVARMYNLSSLISLARWTIANKGAKPLELHKMSNWQTPNTPSKKHRAQGSIARGIKSLIESPSSDPTTSSYVSPTTLTAPNPSRTRQSEKGGSSSRRNSGESTWSVVDDLPLRWATDFVPLAVPGSRLVGATVVGFATWSDETRKDRTGGQLLAIATKSNILLYETPKGERAYRFVKEFYTPLQPRSITFIQQSVAEPRSPVEGQPSSGRFHSHRRTDSGSTLRSANGTSASIPPSFGTHLSLFVVFDKKAGLIRLADSAVGEVELGEDGGPQPAGNLYVRDTLASTISASSLRQRARVSFDIRESLSKWISPVRCNLPVPGRHNETQQVHILTRGKRTHILPCPLPPRASAQPLHAIFWKTHPKHVSARVVISDGDEIDEPPILQLVAFGENGLEVQEMGISFMNPKGKGRATSDEMLRAEEDLGDSGFLAVGGNWDRLEQMYGSMPMPSASSTFSADSMDSLDLLARMQKEQGIYGWCRKGLEDWRVFWVGGNQDLGESTEKYSDGLYD